VSGQLQKQRALASILTALGSTRTIARNRLEYEELAVRICRRVARSPARVRVLRTHLEQLAASSPLFDAALWVRELERALRTAWDAFSVLSSSSPAVLTAATSSSAPVHHLVIPQRESSRVGKERIVESNH
jgi:hypothetical protein